MMVWQLNLGAKDDCMNNMNIYNTKSQSVCALLAFLTSTDRTRMANDSIIPFGSKSIPLIHGGNTLVDEEDYEHINQWEWFQHSAGYAARNPKTSEIRGQKRKLVFIHRIVMNMKIGEITDHINGNTLDNRKCNLRICTASQNAQNKKPCLKFSSQYKGVSWNKKRKRWRVSIKKDGKAYELGRFKNEIDAAKAYNEAAKKLFGPFARLNICG